MQAAALACWLLMRAPRSAAHQDLLGRRTIQAGASGKPPQLLLVLLRGLPRVGRCAGW
jgi:hypothetical protein